MKEFLEKIKDFLARQIHPCDVEEMLKEASDQLVALEYSSTKIYTEVMKEEMISDIKGLDLSKEALEELKNGKMFCNYVMALLRIRMAQIKDMKIKWIISLIFGLILIIGVHNVPLSLVIIFYLGGKALDIIKSEVNDESLSCIKKMEKRSADVLTALENVITFLRTKNEKFYQQPTEEIRKATFRDMREAFERGEHLDLLPDDMEVGDERTFDGVTFELIEKDDQGRKRVRVKTPKKEN